MASTIPPAQLEYYEKHASDNRRPEMIATLVCSLAITYPTVALRFWAKKYSTASIGIDDWLMLIALLPLTGYTACEAVDVHLGVGKHIIFLKKPELFFPTWVAQIPLYAACVVFTKVSILCFYNRIFRSKGLKYISWAIGILVFAYNLALALITCLECIPLDSLWTGKPAKCINVLPSWIALAVINVVTDAMILALPIRHVFRLHMQTTRKIQVCGIFLTGAIVCVFGVLRCTALAKFQPADMTYSVVGSAKWSLAEITVGIVAACLPTMGSIFSRAKSHLSSAKSKAYHGGANGKWSRSLKDSGSHSQPSRKSKNNADGTLSHWTNYQTASDTSRETLTRHPNELQTFVKVGSHDVEQNAGAEGLFRGNDHNNNSIIVQHDIHQFYRGAD